jgi:hypothetical protein
LRIKVLQFKEERRKKETLAFQGSLEKVGLHLIHSQAKEKNDSATCVASDDERYTEYFYSVIRFG